MLIHGSADDFISFDMMGRLYDAKAADDKEMFVADGIGHADTMCELGGAYCDVVFRFINQYAEL